MGEMGSGTRYFKLLWRRHDIYLVFFFLLSGGSSVLGGDIPRLYGCFSVDACRRELMLIPAMWHKTRYLLLGFKLMGLVSVQIVLGIVPSPFLLKFHEQSFLVC